ncbi:hypothetical protein E6H23_11120 [Candidatus Bathyarchaeota archaeon]|nr:MAG: hypothetical protein E6H23_11120 [Candidatus Bathyarchaeota archaeon]
MNLKNKLAVTATILAVMAVVIAQPAHAQAITTRTDQASYTPGGAGTFYITVVNQSPTQTLEIRTFSSLFHRGTAHSLAAAAVQEATQARDTASTLDAYY